MRKQLFFFCLIILVLVGCKKKREVKYYAIPNALSQTCFFQKNSYWVYRNDSTSEIDCTYIKSDPISGNYTFLTNEQFEFVTEFVQMPMQSSLFYQFYISGGYDALFGVPSYYPLFVGIIGYSYCSPGKSAFVLFDDTMTNHQGFQTFECDPGKYQYPAYEGDKFVQMGVISNFKVNNISFDRVSLTKSIFTVPNYSNKIDTIDFYFSFGNGLVKIIFRLDTAKSNYIYKRETQSWSLQKYKIIK